MDARLQTFVSRPTDFARAWRRLHALWRSMTALPAYDRPDAATLRDLGLDASEWDSIRAEAMGHIPPTRRRVVRTP
jgi:hypothetical protein